MTTEDPTQWCLTCVRTRSNRALVAGRWGRVRVKPTSRFRLAGIWACRDCGLGGSSVHPCDFVGGEQHLLLAGQLLVDLGNDQIQVAVEGDIVEVVGRDG